MRPSCVTSPFLQSWINTVKSFCVVSLVRCGEMLSGPSGTITSPNYPNNYDDKRECIWQITTSPGTSVKLTVTVFDVEHHPQCKISYVGGVVAVCKTVCNG